MNPFKAIGGFFAGLFTPSQAKQQETAIAHFAATEIGQLAVDAVVYVDARLQGAGGVAKRDAAVAKLRADALAAGKQIEGAAASTLIWFIETALQAAISKGLVMAVAAIAASEEETPDDGRE